MAKKSFVLYYDQKEIIDELSDEQAGKLFKAIYEYNIEKKETLTGLLKLIFIPFKNTFDRDEKKWEDIAQKRSSAGKKHTGNQFTKKAKMEQMFQEKKDTETFENIEFDKKNNDISNKENGTNGTVSVSGSVSVSVSDSVSVSGSVNKKTTTNHHPPTTTDILDYCLSVFKNYTREELEDVAQKIFIHYSQKKWEGIDDWKSRVKMWVDEDIQKGKIKKLPEWFDKEIKKQEPTPEETEEIEKMLEGFR